MFSTFARVPSAARAAARSFATKAPAKPPIAVYGLSGRYATALYSAAVEEGKLDDVAKRLRSLADLAKRDAAFADFLANPITTSKQRKDVIAAVLAKEKNPPAVLTNFFNVLIDNDRLAVTDAIARDLDELVAAHNGEVVINIQSAAPLDSSSVKRIEKALGASAAAANASKVSFKYSVVPTLLGGILVESDGKTLDLSVQSQVTKLNKAISQSV